MAVNVGSWDGLVSGLSFKLRSRAGEKKLRAGILRTPEWNNNESCR